ncbi:MmpS family transport accessory protein, partial [Bacillus mobilis]|uniref:MmpS family transport accessory protein n=1 Tax=Bacillus mobilis TaxID=2026190 RepID=UPI0036402BA9
VIIIACFVALGAVITISSIASSNNATLTSSSSDASSTSSDYLSGTRSVLYEVEGTAEAVNITYQKSTGMAQQSDLSVPLTRKGTSQRGITFSMNRGDFVYISAQNQGSSGTVTCRISVDGVVVSTVTSRGGYTIATCDGTIR